MATISSVKKADGSCHWPDANIGSNKFYGVDWTTYLTAESDTIGTATWTIPTGLTDSNDSIVSNVARIQLSADTVGEYEVKCQITSTEGGETQTHIQVMNLKVI